MLSVTHATTAFAMFGTTTNAVILFKYMGGMTTIKVSDGNTTYVVKK